MIDDEASFYDATSVASPIATAMGEPIEVRIELPWPNTAYSLAVRSQNHCGESSEIYAMAVTTDIRKFTTVDACFIATAAHGSLYQEDVTTLRRFRDEVLMPYAAGRWFVGAYYSISPPIADAIRGSDAAKAVTRAALTPLVWLAEAVE